jgi:hypothetical protein
VVYDGLGRMLATYRPLCAEPSVVHEYHLDPAGAFHHVHTRVNEVCDDVTAEPTPDPDPLSSELSRRYLAALYFQQPWTPCKRGGRRALRGVALS